MATAKSSKTSKRRARESDRAIARQLVRLYHAGGSWRETIDGVAWEFPVTGDFLARVLETFAEHGTFDVESLNKRDSARVRDGFMCLNVAALRNGGKSATDAIHDVADRHGVSEQTVRNAIYPRPKRKA